MTLFWLKVEHFISFELFDCVHILLACGINTYYGIKMEFHTSDVCISNCYKKYPIGTSILTRIFAFKLFHVSIGVANSISSKYYFFFCYSLLTIFTTNWQNLNKIRWSETHKIWIFLPKDLDTMLTISDFWKRLSVKQKWCLEYLA